MIAHCKAKSQEYGCQTSRHPAKMEEEVSEESLAESRQAFEVSAASGCSNVG